MEEIIYLLENDIVIVNLLAEIATVEMMVKVIISTPVGRIKKEVIVTNQGNKEVEDHLSHNDVVDYRYCIRRSKRNTVIGNYLVAKSGCIVLVNVYLI